MVLRNPSSLQTSKESPGEESGGGGDEEVEVEVASQCAEKPGGPSVLVGGSLIFSLSLLHTLAQWPHQMNPKARAVGFN